jgi:NarL family two-component system response regulator LiaR
MKNPIRIFLADDHPIVRRGIRDLFETERNFDLVGEATNGREAVEGVKKHAPDIILMDLVMPEMDGIEAIQQIISSSPDARIIVLTSFSTDDKVYPAIKAGAIGYLIKDTAPGDLIEAIYKVYERKVVLDPSIAQMLLVDIANPSSAPPTPDPLTTREVDVLRLIAKGLNNQEIADHLVISMATVYTHVSKILSKLHLASRTQAALYAIREGYASLNDDD